MSLFRRAVEPFLPDRDYLPVAMPTSDLHVLYVLLIAGYRVPEPTTTWDAAVVDVSGSMTKSTKLGLGVSAVSAVLRALGGDAGLRLSSTNARTIQYGYSNVSADRVDLVTLDRWLTAADFDPGRPVPTA